MNRRCPAINLLVLLALMGGTAMSAQASTKANGGPPRAMVAPLPPGAVRLNDPFLAPWRERLIETTLPSQWQRLSEHYHIHNFRVAAGDIDGVHLGPLFLDSDLYKWLEAAGYALAWAPDQAQLKTRTDEIIDLIERSQMDDGYLNTYYQSLAPERRWEILWTNHELYCAGHFMEAACAFQESSGDGRLLEAARKLADHIEAEFGPAGREGVPGHEEIELALARLYRSTGDPRYLDLAASFVYRRGRGRHFKRELIEDLAQQSRLSAEANRKRNPYLSEEGGEADTSFGFAHIDPLLLPRSLHNFYTGRYFQAHKPVVVTDVAEGHAVRAMYLYAGAADVYLETGDHRLYEALVGIWDNTIEKRTYLTGGMGSFSIIEGFGRDYELPNDSYTETCAAIASLFFSWRMLQATGEARHAGQMERAFYNAILGGISLDGDRYFYQNPLRSRGDREREPWYTVACCPPNIARLLASIERYAWGQSEDGVWVHLYLAGEATIERPEGRARLVMDSALPWRGTVSIRVEVDGPMAFALRLRVPGWADGASIRVNGAPLSESLTAGSYHAIERQWRTGDLVELEIGMGPRLIEGRPQVKANRGKAALALGPLIYCVEDVDNPGLDVHKIKLAPEPELELRQGPAELDGLMAIKARTRDGREITAIPFYAWGNRGRSHMEVWLDR